MVLPEWIEEIFEKYLTAEFTYLDGETPRTIAVLPYYDANRKSVVITTSPTFYNEVRCVKKNPMVSVLPISKIVLFVGEDELPGEKRAREVAEELKDDLSTVWDVGISRVDKRNVIRAAIQLIEEIKREKGERKEVLINASGSLCTLAIAGYIAACVTNSRIFTSIPKYNEKEEEVGIEEIIEIPTLPIDFPAELRIASQHLNEGKS